MARAPKPAAPAPVAPGRYRLVLVSRGLEFEHRNRYRHPGAAVEAGKQLVSAGWDRALVRDQDGDVYAIELTKEAGHGR